MPGTSSCQNGRKGGRPIGSENEATKIRRSMRMRWLQRTNEMADKLLEAQMDLALGSYAETPTPSGEIRVYKRNPDRRAIEWLLEQVWGKAPQSESPEEKEENVDILSKPISKEMRASLDRAISFAIPQSRRT